VAKGLQKVDWSLQQRVLPPICTGFPNQRQHKDSLLKKTTNNISIIFKILKQLTNRGCLSFTYKLNLGIVTIAKKLCSFS
jgi:hypothetical protein